MLTRAETFTLVSTEMLHDFAPEFDAYQNRDGAIKMANNLIIENACPRLRPLLVTMLAAHFLQLSGRPLGANGDVISMKEEGLAIQFAKSAVSKKILSNTTYGAMYTYWLAQCGSSLRITRVGGLDSAYSSSYYRHYWSSYYDRPSQ